MRIECLPEAGCPINEGETEGTNVMFRSIISLVKAKHGEKRKDGDESLGCGDTMGPLGR